MLFSFVLIPLGILAGHFLFFRLRFLLPLKVARCGKSPKISVIIPARNEAHNLPGLLSSLRAQTLQPHEIICIDDASTDKTAAVAKSFGVKVLQVAEKPHGWMGKSYACHLGAQAASGTLYLFVDADVRFDKTALMRLFATWQVRGPVVSVQPWHTTVHLYEQCCLFFNMIAAAALAASVPLGRETPGLFGPVILMPATLYRHCGGHEAVKSSILDDISLGKCLCSLGIRPYCCQGGQDIRYRMYPTGCHAMLEGWTKNFASGAGASPLSLWVPITLWMAALLGVPIQSIEWFLQAPSPLAFFFVFLSYFVLCFQLQAVSMKIGRFTPIFILFYPLALFSFLWIFSLSTFKKIFHLPVFWKGRNVSEGI